MWLGLALAIFLIIEAVTGFILLEPWIVGMDKSKPAPESNNFIEGNKSPAIQEPNSEKINKEINPRQAPNQNNAYGIVRKIHEGIFGSLNFKWLLEITVIGLIILTLTGIYLSIPILKAQF